MTHILQVAVLLLVVRFHSVDEAGRLVGRRLASLFEFIVVTDW